MAALSVVAASVRPNNAASHPELAVAGAAITHGQLVYKTANKFYPASKATEASAKATHMAMSPASGDGDLISVLPTLTEVFIGVAVTQGLQYYLGTAGQIIPVGDLATNDWVTTVGIGGSNQNLKLNIFASGEQKP